MRTFVKAEGVLQPRYLIVSGVKHKPNDVFDGPAYLFDYQTGDFSQWYAQHMARPEQEVIVTSPARSGYLYTARFIMAEGDHVFGLMGYERGEVAASPAQTGDPDEGKAQWFAWSSFFPTGMHLDVPGGWLVFTQWHHAANTGQPNVRFELSQDDPPKALLKVRGQSLDLETGAMGYVHDWDLGLLPMNTWVDFAIYIAWSADPALGHVTVKINGSTVCDAACATLYTDWTTGTYLKQGLYGGNSAQTYTIYHTGTRMGPTEASVAL
jgi:Polysaccharide lyase